MTLTINDALGSALLRELVGGNNALRHLDVFACNRGEHDEGCECFWEQCEAWAKADKDANASQYQEGEK